jgi:hypothetical protein
LLCRRAAQAELSLSCCSLLRATPPRIGGGEREVGPGINRGVARADAPAGGYCTLGLVVRATDAAALLLAAAAREETNFQAKGL